MYSLKGFWSDRRGRGLRSGLIIGYSIMAVVSGLWILVARIYG